MKVDCLVEGYWALWVQLERLDIVAPGVFRWLCSLGTSSRAHVADVAHIMGPIATLV